MRVDEDGTEQRTLYCGNLSDQVTDEVLYELFLQAGPLQSLRRPREPSGRPKSFAFIVYKHECSVPYALELFRGEKLFNRALNLSGRSRLHHIPVLDTHLSEFTEHFEENPQQRKEGRFINRSEDSPQQRNEGRFTERFEENPQQRNEERFAGLFDYNPHQRKEGRDHRSGTNRRRSDRVKDDNEPTSWAELNALKGKGSLMHGGSTFQRDDLRGAPLHSKASKHQDNPASIPDFNSLLQMGNQMMLPGMLPGMLPVMLPAMLPGMLSMTGSPMGSMSPMGHNMYPSMQGGMSGGKRYSPERERRNDNRGARGSRRDHPYQDKRQGNDFNDNRRHSDFNDNRRHSDFNDNRRYSDNHNDHRRHDRGYSSSRSSHERERRDRRSR